MVQLIRYFQKIVMRCVLFPLRIFGIKKNRIVIYNNLSQKYAGNPKCIAEYLLSEYEGLFDIVLPLGNSKVKKELSKRSVKIVRVNSWWYFYYCMTAKVFVTNSGGCSYIPLRKTQMVINTHHGGGAYKKSGIDMFGDTFFFRKDMGLSAKQTDVFLSTNERFTEVMSMASLVPKDKFWEIGMPRNDILIRGDEKLRKITREKLGIKENQKMVLFAPTYRKTDDNYFNDSIAISYGIDVGRVCRALKQRFGGEWIFAMRLHPCVVNRDGVIPKGCLDLSDYEDMQELLLAADVLINDFSSSMWDYMLTGKPGFMFALDLQHYIDTTDVYIPVSEWPFLCATSNDDLENNILKFNQEQYRERCEYHYNLLGGCETGEATRLVCERIYQECFVNQ